MALLDNDLDVYRTAEAISRVLRSPISDLEQSEASIFHDLVSGSHKSEAKHFHRAFPKALQAVDALEVEIGKLRRAARIAVQIGNIESAGAIRRAAINRRDPDLILAAKLLALRAGIKMSSEDPQIRPILSGAPSHQRVFAMLEGGSSNRLSVIDSALLSLPRESTIGRWEPTGALRSPVVGVFDQTAYLVRDTFDPRLLVFVQLQLAVCGAQLFRLFPESENTMAAPDSTGLVTVSQAPGEANIQIPSELEPAAWNQFFLDLNGLLIQKQNTHLRLEYLTPINSVFRIAPRLLSEADQRAAASRALRKLHVRRAALETFLQAVREEPTSDVAIDERVARAQTSTKKILQGQFFEDDLYDSDLGRQSGELMYRAKNHAALR